MSNMYCTKKILSDEETTFINDGLDFFSSSPDPFHVIDSSSKILKQAGFVEIIGSSFIGKIAPGGKYYYTRNKSTLVAFTVGNDYISGKGGFKVIGAHTDSPNLRIKPKSKRPSSSSAVIQIGVEVYGGGLWHTWFDRDLGISGRVFVKENCGGSGSGSSAGTHKIEQKLIKIDRSLLRVSNLAIHLTTAKEREAFLVNKEDHLSPILATEVLNALVGQQAPLPEQAATEAETKEKETKEEASNNNNGWTEYQEPLLLQMLSKELNCRVEDIIDFELNLFDTQQASLGGMYSEFIHSARLDNLASCYMAVKAISQYSNASSGDGSSGTEDNTLLSVDQDISMIVLFDHEEVGSDTAVGAASPIMSDAVRSISLALLQNDSNNNNNNHQDIYASSIANSFVLSCDQAHAIHPNYTSKHEKNHAPTMNNGMVIKRNCNQRYATNGITGLILREIARRNDDQKMNNSNKKARLFPTPVLQEFIIRQDCRCGSTIGPIISTATGIRTIDIGCPSLSMHSIREVMGVHDLIHGYDLFQAFFRYFREVDSSIEQ